MLYVSFVFKHISFGYKNITAEDIRSHCCRITGIAEGLKGGQFPVKYYSNFANGKGYISSLFYGDLFLYLPALLVLCGIPVLYAYNVFLYFIILLIFISFYFLAKKILKSTTLSLLSAIIFIMSKYIFSDVFYRGAIGEAIAIIFFIWLIYGIYNLLYENYSKLWILSIFLLGILYSHKTTLVIACALLVVVGLK